MTGVEDYDTGSTRLTQADFAPLTRPCDCAGRLIETDAHEDHCASMRRPYVLIGDWIAEDTGDCTCGTGGTAYGHEPGCRTEPLIRLTDVEGLDVTYEWGNDTPGVGFVQRSSESSAIGQCTQNGWPVVRRAVIRSGWFRV